MNESELIRDILEGEREKFRFLMEKYQLMVFRTCMGFVHNKDDADDLTQDVFLQAYQSLKTFKLESAFSTWLYRIAINASLNKIRRSSITSLLHRIDSVFGMGNEIDPVFSVSDLEDPENILIREEHSLWIRKALDALPENQRTAIILSKYDDLSQKEIAEIMNTSEGAVEALIQRAKKTLRKKLSGILKKNA